MRTSEQVTTIILQLEKGVQSMTQHCHYERRKRRIGNLLFTATITALLCAAIVIAVLWAAWHGMSSELCGRNLPPAEYQAMKLDCREYGYDRQ